MKAIVAERCRSCDRDVYWLRHERTGKTAPIDVDPSEDGNVICNFDAGTYRVASPSEPPLPGLERVAALRLNHFATCPQASRWKGR